MLQSLLQSKVCLIRSSESGRLSTGKGDLSLWCALAEDVNSRRNSIVIPNGSSGRLKADQEPVGSPERWGRNQASLPQHLSTKSRDGLNIWCESPLHLWIDQGVGDRINHQQACTCDPGNGSAWGISTLLALKTRKYSRDWDRLIRNQRVIDKTWRWPGMPGDDQAKPL